MALGALAVALVGAVPFFAATTFTGDDHVFLAFARHAQNPLAAFTSDLHGGEFYRPLPMLLWWVLGRAAGGATWPFAAMAFLLHLVVALELGMLVAASTSDRRAAFVAGCFFFLAPATREAAYWYSASTDLLAAAGALGVLLVGLRGQWVVANVLLLAACFCKESAVVVPLLAVVVFPVRHSERPARMALLAGARLLPAATLAVVVRTAVLRGIGGSGDPVSPLPHKLGQLVLGLLEAVPARDIFGEPWSALVGSGVWLGVGILVFFLSRRPDRPKGLLLPVAWMGAAALPLVGAPSIIGARYFYLPFGGIAWLWASILGRAPRPAAVAALSCLGGLALAQAVTRHADVTSYEARVAVARRAVIAGLAQGHRTFHVAAGVKDIDLAVKEDPRLAQEPGLVVLGDVPASFVSLPASGPSRVDFLLAHPPLPPAGAYWFGDRRIVGLARRGDDPTLDEVMAKLPDLRFIRLRIAFGGRVIYRDVTETLGTAEDE